MSLKPLEPSPEQQRTRFVLFLLAFPVVTTLTNTARSVGIPHLPLLLLGYGGLAFLAWRGSHGLLKAIPRATWILAGIFILGVADGLMRAEDPSLLANELISGVALGLVWMFAMASITNFAPLLRATPWVGAALLLSVLLDISVLGADLSPQLDYNQYLGYATLPAAILLADSAFNSKRVGPAALAITAWVAMLAMGARGPVVAGILYVALRLFLVLRRRLIPTVLVIGLLTVTALNIDSLLRWLHGVLSSFGMSTRVLDRQGEGSLFQDDSRVKLLNETIEIIKSNPWFGVGAGNERPILASLLDPGTQESVGWYPHNVLLEIPAQLGLLLGGAAVLALVVRTVRCLLDRSDAPRARLTLVFVSLGLFPLLFSGSYLDWPWFYGLLGLLSRPLPSKSDPTAPRVT